jgi:hypothetical protein
MNLPDHRLINWAAKVLLRGGVSPKDIYKQPEAACNYPGSEPPSSFLAS